MVTEKNYTVKIDSFWGNFSKPYKKWAAEHGMEYYEFSIIYELCQREKLRQKDICEAYSYPKQSINRVAINLKEKGIIDFIPSEKDKREKEIVLTEKGKEFAEKNFTELFEMEKRVFEKIGKDALEKMINTANLLTELVGEEMNNGK
ncbi:MAG: winged helix-turn-helix transcriptional regulator [Oscillospiraceae bacterium]|nr:winged helix-turn-helix transcriptional regulator [Oscillospiraceae bacterium]